MKEHYHNPIRLQKMKCLFNIVGNLPRALKGRPDDFVATFTGDTAENFKIGITANNKSLGVSFDAPVV